MCTQLRIPGTSTFHTQGSQVGTVPDITRIDDCNNMCDNRVRHSLRYTTLYLLLSVVSRLGTKSSILGLYKIL